MFGSRALALKYPGFEHAHAQYTFRTFADADIVERHFARFIRISYFVFDLFFDLCQVCIHLLKNAYGVPIAFAQKAQHQMLRTNVAVL